MTHRRTDPDEVLARYWDAVDAQRTGDALAVLGEALDAGTGAEELLEVVARAQQRVGDLWQTNEWSVAREHAATAIGERAVRALGTRIPEPGGGRRLLVACVEREWHALPGMLLTEHLRLAGRPCTFLGADTSRDRLVGAILDQGPSAVLLSASLTGSLPRARRHIETVRSTGTPVLVGGAAWDADGVWARRLGATAQAADAREALDVLPRLPSHVDPLPAATGAAADEARGLAADTADVVRHLTAVLADVPGPGATVLTDQLLHLVDSVVAGLLVEDGEPVRRATAWFTNLAASHAIRADVAPRVLTALHARLRDYPLATQMLATVHPGSHG